MPVEVDHPEPSKPGGLRERKRLKTRQEIQVQALRLFAEQGYEATTVEQIADAAIISESTFYRYFPSKADVVLADDFDPLFIAAFAVQPAELTAVQAITAALRTVMSQIGETVAGAEQERMRLFWTIPELRAAALDQLIDGIGMMARLVAERTGRPAGDTEVRALAGAVVGAAIAGLLAAESLPNSDLFAVVSDHLDHVEAALRLT